MALRAVPAHTVYPLGESNTVGKQAIHCQGSNPTTTCKSFAVPAPSMLHMVWFKRRDYGILHIKLRSSAPSTPPTTPSSITSNSASTRSKNTSRLSADQVFVPEYKCTSQTFSAAVTSATRSDGRTVTSDAQLWAVPEEILPHTPTSSAKKVAAKTLFAPQQRPDCALAQTCDQVEDCWEHNCSRCIREPVFGCPSLACTPQYRCAFNI